MKKYIIVGILILVIITLGKLYLAMKKDRDRLQENQAELLEKAGLFRKDSAENVRQLILTIQELKESRSVLVEKIKDQGVKPKDIQGVTTMVAEANAEINAPLRDSIRLIDTIPKITSMFNWTDGYFTLDGVIEEKILTASGTYRDTLYQILYRIPRRFLFIRWGTKEIRQIAWFGNPRAKIVFQEVIKIEKEKHSLLN